VTIFDTTLRDGEQIPGLTYTIDEKVEIAKKLDELGVGKIEAGFAITSEGEAEAIKRIAALGLSSTARARLPLKSLQSRAMQSP
jgi:isopropylmalate/homocitrate/citramalate synthase